MAEVIFCKCGHIHIVSDEQIDKAIASNKDHLLICASCGASYAIGADYVGPDEGYYMHRYELKEEVMSPDNIKERFSEVVYSKGHIVPMMSGYSANYYFNGRFSDERAVSMDEVKYRMMMDHIQFEEAFERLNQDRHTVNMSLFIRRTPDSVLNQLCSYHIEGFDWSGTKYDKE